jgi:rhamnulokinase
MSVHLAFDLGAQSGRAILGELTNNTLSLREIHRFPTGITEINGHLYWDIFRIFAEIIKALKICSGICTPDSIGVDTWGVDFGLLSESGELLGLPFSYRDARTQGAMDAFFKKMNRRDVYFRTGIQLLGINSLFQLEAQMKSAPEILSKASKLLFIPDIINYFLCGTINTEFTIATTSQLYNPHEKNWDQDIINALGINPGILQKIVQPGTVLGTLGAELSRQTSMPGVPVVSVASHDTASAVAAIPAEGKNWAYISSGTWSLMGIESPFPVINDTTYELNFTNEGGVFGTFRILKNITGMWLLEECRRSWEKQSIKTTHEELVSAAHKADDFQAYLNPDHALFKVPGDMPLAIKEYCLKTNQKIPDDKGGICRMIMESLALKYNQVLDEIRQICTHDIDTIHMVGGGSKNTMMCDFTAQATGVKVIAGPVEATAIGNVLMQAASIKEINDLEELRSIVRHSVSTADYLPETDSSRWKKAKAEYKRIIAEGCQ